MFYFFPKRRKRNFALFPLAKEANICLWMETQKEHHSYIKDIKTDHFDGSISGGGTAYSTTAYYEYHIYIENAAQEPRVFQYEVEIFKDKKQKLLSRRLTERTILLNPGQAYEKAFEVFSNEQTASAVLTKFISKDLSGNVTESYEPRWNMYRMAAPTKVDTFGGLAIAFGSIWLAYKLIMSAF